MGDCFYQQIVAVDSSTDTVPESGASVRRVGDSVGSYLQDSARGSRRRVSDSAGSSSRRGFTDDEIHMLSCSLLSQRRGPRRAFLEATDSSTRRRLIAECKAIHARVQDSCIEYTPEVCWAINAVIENEDPKGYAILKKSYKSLPEEVKRFYDAFVENRYSVEAQEAQSLLGPYRLVQDDERVAAFLEGGATQEAALDDVVEEASVAGEELYDDALDALDDLSDQAAIMAQDFASEVATMYTNGLGDIVAGQVSGGAEEASEEIVDNPPAESDVESEDDPAQDDDEVVEEITSEEVGDSAPVRVPNKRSARPVVDSSAKKYAENKRYSKPVVDASPKHRVANKRVKDSCAAPSLPLPVGSSVQVSYLGNLYTGVITSVGDGSVIVSGLPIEYFNVRAENGAFTGSDADYTFASTDVVVLPADGSSVALDGPSVESEVAVEENTVEEPTSAGGYVPSIMMDDDEKIEDAIGNTPFEQELRGILRDGCVGHEDDDIFDIPLVADFSLHVDGSNPNNISAHVFEGTVDCGGLMIPTGGLSDDEKGLLFVDKVTEFIKEKLGPQVFTLVDLDDVFNAADSASVSDSAVDFDVDKILSAVQAGVDISNSDSSVGIFYDDGSDYGADSSVLFVTEEGTDIVPVSEAVGYLSSHLDAFKEAISESADAIGEALGAIGADVVSGDVHIEDAAAGDEVSSSVSEEIVEEQGVSETGSPEAIDWGAVGGTCRQWVLDNSFKLAQEPTDVNLQTACGLLSAGLEVLHLEVRFDPSVPRVLCKNQRFIDVRPDGAYVGTVAFFYQTSDSAISKFASDFSDAAVQLAHKIYDIPEVSDSAPTGVDGAYVDFESKDGLLRALDAVQAGGDAFRYVRVEDDEDGKFIVAMADTFGRDKKYMSEDGETSDRAEAVRFSDKHEAFERLKQLIKDGKITYSLFNTWPEEVMDDDSLLSDAAKQEVLHSIESEIKKALEEKEILVEDSVVVGIDVDRVQDGAPNTFDIPHTASTFRRIRNTKRILDSVLGVASDVLGERLTPSVYKSLCKSGSRAAKAKVSKVMDSALAMDALDLYCSDIYKRKLSDSYWVCDDVQKVADSFKLDGLSGASGSCLVSTTPFDESLSAGKQVTCFKCGSKSDIYIMLL